MTAECPDDLALARFADDDLAPEPRNRIKRHLTDCGQCARHAEALRGLCEAIAEPPAIDVPLERHVGQVMARIERSPGTGRPTRVQRALALGSALAASVALFALFLKDGSDGSHRPAAELVARGANGAPSLARDVGVQVYRLAPAPHALQPGATLTPGTPLTVTYRNLGETPAHLLVFLVDADRQVHWLAPAYTDPGTDPQAVRATTTTEERPLATTVMFDDLAPGPARLVTVISRRPHRVSAVERLEPAQRLGARLTARLSRAEIREIAVRVKPAPAPPKRPRGAEL